MTVPKSCWLLGLVLAACLVSGCSGVMSGSLIEKKYDDGRIERVKIDGGESWSWNTYDRNPTKEEDTCIILRQEKTF